MKFKPYAGILIFIAAVLNAFVFFDGSLENYLWVSRISGAFFIVVFICVVFGYIGLWITKRNWTRASIFASVVAVFFIGSGVFRLVSPPPSSVDSAIIGLVERLNESLPAKTDEVTTLDALSYSDNHLVYEFSIARGVISSLPDFRKSVIVDELREQYKNDQGSQELQKSLKRDGKNVRHVYREDGEIVLQFAIW